MAGGKGGAAKPREAAGPAQLLPPELLANIHDRLEFLDRIAFATVFAASCDHDEYVFSPPVPWLLLSCEKKKKKDLATATLFSLADRRAATVRAPYPAMRGHVVLGSSRGWLATADDKGQIHLVNPATGEQRALPDINTMAVFRQSNDGFQVCAHRLLTARFGQNCWGTEGYGMCVIPADEMRLRFYQKVVLAIGRRPTSHAAMLILFPSWGAPAFATTEDGGAWRLAPSRVDVEDAIHHDGRFHSVSYSGTVDAWERDEESGAYTSTAVTPRLTTVGIGEEEEESMSSRKYLAAAPGGRLMVVVKYWTKDEHYTRSQKKWACSFHVHVLGDDGQWKETRDIGDAALFVGMNNSLCVPTMRRPGIEAGCVYFTDDGLWKAAIRKRNKDLSRDDVVSDDVRPVGVYSLKDGKVKTIDGLGRQQYRSFLPTPPVWIIPTIP